MNWSQRLALACDEHAGLKVRRRVVTGFDEIDRTDPEAVARWLTGAVERLKDLVDDATFERILSDCACTFPEHGIEALRRLREKGATIDKLLEAMENSDERLGWTLYPHFKRRGDQLLVTKVPFDAEAFEAAVDARARRQAYCHCPLVRNAETLMPHDYCLCGSGWFRQLWEGVLGVEVRISVERSVAAGDEDCTFIVHLPAGLE